MKRTITSILLAFFLLGSVPGMAYAHDGGSRTSSSTDVQSLLQQINSLMAQIAALQAQVKAMKGAVSDDIKKRQEEHQVLVKCKESEGYYAWNKRGKGKHFGQWKKYYRWCNKNGTSTDTVAPTLSSIAVTGITGNSAVVNWVTNEASDSTVLYGLTSGYGSTSTNATLLTSHSLTLSSLAPTTTYHFQVRSKDAAGNLVTSSDVTFTTTGAVVVDTTAPVISSLAISNITSTGATLTWTTDEGADSQVAYGTTTGYGSLTTLDTSLVTSHSVNVTGLTGSTLYHVQARSKDGSANPASSSDLTFTTLAPADTTAPVVSGISAIVGSTTATVNWTTNENATSKVYYGTGTPLVLGSAASTSNPSLVLSHGLPLSGLSASTTYYYVVESADAVNNVATSSQQSFTTGN